MTDILDNPQIADQLSAMEFAQETEQEVEYDLVVAEPAERSVTRAAVSGKEGIGMYSTWLLLGHSPIVETTQGDHHLATYREIAQRNNGMLVPFTGPVLLSDVAANEVDQRLVFEPYADYQKVPRETI